jgi:hypothetical protein
MQMSIIIQSFIVHAFLAMFCLAIVLDDALYTPPPLPTIRPTQASGERVQIETYGVIR